MVGDRDHFCSVEEATLAFRHVAAGELAVLPATGHIITTTKIDLMVDFLHRTRTDRQGPTAPVLATVRDNTTAHANLGGAPPVRLVGTRWTAATPHVAD
jgi:hypothetical protein